MAAQSIEELADLYQSGPDEFKPRQLSLAVSRVPKLMLARKYKATSSGSRQSTASRSRQRSLVGYDNNQDATATAMALLDDLTAGVMTKITSLDVASVANVLHGYAKMQYRPGKPVLAALCKQLRPERLVQDQGKHMGILFWSLARLKVVDPEVWKPLVAAAEVCLDPAHMAKNVSLCFWALGHLKVLGVRFVGMHDQEWMAKHWHSAGAGGALPEASSDAASGPEAGEGSRAASPATFRPINSRVVDARALSDVLLMFAGRLAGELGPQAIGNIMWGAGHMCAFHPEHYGLLVMAAKQNVSAGSFGCQIRYSFNWSDSRSRRLTLHYHLPGRLVAWMELIDLTSAVT